MAPPRKLSEGENKLIDVFAELILDTRVVNQGRIPHGFMETYLKILQASGIQVTRDIMKGRIKLFEKKMIMARRTIPFQIHLDGATVASDVTKPRFDTSTSTVSSDNNALRDPSGRATEQPEQTVLAQLRTRLINEVTLEHVRLHEAKKDKNARLPKGTLRNLIKQKRIELGLPDFVKIPMNTIRNRREKGRCSLCPKHRGKQNLLL